MLCAQCHEPAVNYGCSSSVLRNDSSVPAGHSVTDADPFGADNPVTKSKLLLPPSSIMTRQRLICHLLNRTTITAMAFSSWHVCCLVKQWYISPPCCSETAVVATQQFSSSYPAVSTIGSVPSRSLRSSWTGLRISTIARYPPVKPLLFEITDLRQESNLRK